MSQEVESFFYQLANGLMSKFINIGFLSFFTGMNWGEKSKTWDLSIGVTIIFSLVWFCKVSKSYSDYSSSGIITFIFFSLPSDHSILRGFSLTPCIIKSLFISISFSGLSSSYMTSSYTSGLFGSSSSSSEESLWN